MERTREQIYRDIEAMFGLVPSMFKQVPDSSLELEWQPELSDGPRVIFRCQQLDRSERTPLSTCLYSTGNRPDKTLAGFRKTPN